MTNFRYFLAFLAYFVAYPLFAQLPQGAWLTWEDFVAEYVDGNEWAEGKEPTDEQLEWLEGLALQPLQLNRMARGELIALPFVSEAQADSIVAYRTAKQGIRSLGELQLISGIDYYTRRYLSLFVRCDSLPLPDEAKIARRDAEHRLGHKFSAGEHEIETRLDVPLYQREGYKKPEEPSASNYYTGNALHHTMRYRYTYKREVAYGFTAEKDAGEPVCKRGFYPYDYLSGYMMLRPSARAWSFVAGDYEVRGGSGLLFGRQYFAGREQIAQAARRAITTFRPHTSSDESNFLRGAAASFAHGAWDVMAFASLRKLDARLSANGDTALTILRTGLHRTVAEVERRRTLPCLTTGAHVGYNRQHFGIALDAYVAHYGKVVWPAETFYNAYYFRGQTATGVSASYFATHRAWTVQGEIAADQKLHVATKHTLAYAPNKRLNFNIQLRCFSPRFISCYGSTLQQGSRVANEQGIIVSMRYRSSHAWELSGYLDFFRFPKPTYTAALSGAKGLEAQMQGKWKVSGRWHLQMSYRLKTRQRTVTGYELLEYRQSHKLRVAALWQNKKREINMQIDGTLATRQTGKQAFGGMLSARATFKPSPRLSLKTFAGIFFTDDYESAVYAYEPQLLRAASFGAFAYHGARAVALCQWQAWQHLSIGIRLGSTCYFNRTSQSSGAAAIHSAWKNDISLQLRLRLGKTSGGRK